MLCGTVSQIQVDQALIGDAFSLCHIFEVVDCFFVQANGYLLFKLIGIRVFNRDANDLSTELGGF